MLADGSVWCRGTNTDGQIGDGTTAHAQDFVQVVGIDDAIDVAVGAFHTCALHRDGEVSCWGRNDTGQLGRGTTTADEPIPAPTLPIGVRIDQIEAGCSHTCARGGARAWCWGSNNALQLGTGVLGDSAIPVEAWAGPDAL